MKKGSTKVKDIEVVRYSPSIEEGLNQTQIQERIENNLLNFDTTIRTKSYTRIILDNVFTVFNAINLFLALLIISIKEYFNALFILVAVSNSLIAIIQGIYAKKTIDKLSLISQTKSKVVRDSKEELISINEIALDDIIVLKAGDQVPSDSIILKGVCDVDESLLTGESDAIEKAKGDSILSGSFLVSGECIAKVEHINYQNYSYSILKGAKYIKQTKSKIITVLNTVLKVIAMLCLPLGIAYFSFVYFKAGHTFHAAVLSTATGIVGMIPQGLILLTNTVFGVSSVRLAKKKTMIQDLYAAEALARVDVLCLDKTGTITEGSMEFSQLIPLNKHESEEIEEVLNAFVSLIKDENPTMNAIRGTFLKEGGNHKALNILPFSSKYKYSGVEVENLGSYLIGAAEMLYPKMPAKLKAQIDDLSQENRVLLLVSTTEKLEKGKQVKKVKPMALLVLRDKIRQTAIQTFKYFHDQGVEIRVISGDSLVTVSNIARRAEIANYDKAIDMSTISSDRDIEEAANKYTVFARVSPEQKKKIIRAMRAAGHVVAMTGDGANDVLALKEADCSIAMASGSDAAKNVSQVVLLDSNFEKMPGIVLEGRASINNLQCYGALFLVKTIYSMLMMIALLAQGRLNPIKPANLTIVSAFFIGAPAFWLSMLKNSKKMEGKFLLNILSRSIPIALTAFVMIMTTIKFFEINYYDFSIQIENDLGTTAFFVFSLISLIALIKISETRLSDNKKHMINAAAVIAYFLTVVVTIKHEALSRRFYIFEFSDPRVWYLVLLLLTLSILTFFLFNSISTKIVFPLLSKRGALKKKFNRQK